MKRQQIIILAAVFTAFITLNVSCSKVPVPEENPVYLSSDAQTYTVNVRYLKTLDFDPYYFGTITIIGSWQKLEADWIDVYFKKNDGDIQELKIIVKENTDNIERHYKFGLGHLIRNQYGFECLTMTVYQESGNN